jgi:hypothetical protein
MNAAAKLAGQAVEFVLHELKKAGALHDLWYSGAGRLRHGVMCSAWLPP